MEEHELVAAMHQIARFAFSPASCLMSIACVQAAGDMALRARGLRETGGVNAERSDNYPTNASSREFLMSQGCAPELSPYGLSWHGRVW